MNSVAVVSATLLVVLATADTASARHVSIEQQTKSKGDDWPLGLRVAANGSTPVTIKKVAGARDEPIPLNLTPPSDGLKFVLFRQVSEDVEFSHGFRLKNAWMVSIRDLDKLTLIPPPGFDGALTLQAFYHRDNESGVIAQDVIIVEVGQTASTRETSANLEIENPPTASVTAEINETLEPPEPAISPEQESEDLARGAQLFENGDVGSARIIYEFLASQGSAKGARALAETYDPAVLKDMIIAGLQPDLETARKWYKRAAELGDEKAANRLSSIQKSY